VLDQVGAIVTPFLAEKFDQLECVAVTDDPSIPRRKLSISGGALLLRLNDVNVEDDEYASITELFQQVVYDTDAGEMIRMVFLDTHDQVKPHRGERIGNADVSGDTGADLLDTAGLTTTMLDLKAVDCEGKKGDGEGKNGEEGKTAAKPDRRSVSPPGVGRGENPSFVSLQEEDEDDDEEELSATALNDAQFSLGQFSTLRTTVSLSATTAPAELVAGFSLHRSDVPGDALPAGGGNGEQENADAELAEALKKNGFMWRPCMELAAPDEEALLLAIGQQEEGQEQPTRQQEVRRWFSQQVSKLSSAKRRVAENLGAGSSSSSSGSNGGGGGGSSSSATTTESGTRIVSPTVELVSSEFTPPDGNGKSQDWQQQQQRNDAKEERELCAIKASIKPFTSEPVVVEYQVVFGEGPIGLRFKAKASWEAAQRLQPGLPPPPPPPPPRSGVPSVCNVVVDCFPELRSGAGPAYKASMQRKTSCSGQLRSGSQLVSINAASTVNLSFAKVMSMLRHAARPLTLQFREAASTGLDQLDGASSEQEVAEAVARLWREKAPLMAEEGADGDEGEDETGDGAMEKGDASTNNKPGARSTPAEETTGDDTEEGGIGEEGEDTEEEQEEEVEVTTAAITAGLSRVDLLSVGSVGSVDDDYDQITPEQLRFTHARQMTPEMAWVQKERRRLDSEDFEMKQSNSALDLLKMAMEEENGQTGAHRERVDSDDYEEGGVNSDDYDEGDEERQGKHAAISLQGVKPLKSSPLKSPSPLLHKRAASDPSVPPVSPAATSAKSFSPTRRTSMMRSVEEQQVGALNTLLEQKLKTLQQHMQTLEGKLRRSEAAKLAAEAETRASEGAVDTEAQRVQGELGKARTEAREAKQKLREYEWQQQVDSNSREQLEQQQQQRLQRQEDSERSTRQQWQQLQQQLEQERAEREAEVKHLEEKLQQQLEQQLQQAKREAEAQAEKENGQAKQEAEQARRETEQAAAQAAVQLGEAEEQAKKEEEARGVAEKEVAELQRSLAEAKAAAEKEKQGHEKEQLLMRHKLASAEARREELAQAAAEREKEALSPKQTQMKKADSKDEGAGAEQEAAGGGEAMVEELAKARAELTEALHRLTEQEQREKERVMQLEEAVEEGHRQRQEQVRYAALSSTTLPSMQRQFS
jgi:hypothetical protein